ncbi:uncharacterized protein BCR38DRAFT_426164 [Pseudomassariella vexata]|uniref:Uncharacterized protein n=1 Tax=Pseudomassariella vexata TaxID=1141098 RepID=A0A1Y2E785_9PEZI|nr:uncharacterized protein BCR38DRAFT_426164 [Pseudomassariella vexata]ORY67136.1 hypothetical protein BCR38DRAFT_426164 [Pseudomassariella vexata]
MPSTMSQPTAQRRARSPSSSSQSRPSKRQRCHRSNDSPRPPSSSSGGTSIGTSIGKYYGIGDKESLDNIFASFPQTFTTVPEPHGSRGRYQPLWELRNDHEIYLSNDLLPNNRDHQRVRTPIPGPESHIPPPGSRNRSTLTRLAQQARQEASDDRSYRQTRSQVDTLGIGRTTGTRARGRPMQPSIRRRRSQWEICLSSDEEIL